MTPTQSLLSEAIDPPAPMMRIKERRAQSRRFAIQQFALANCNSQSQGGQP
jgi:hypothetical protein